MNSTHKVEVVPVVLEPHPNADSLSIVRVFSGYTVVVKSADWEGKTTGAYVPPDSVLPETEEFAFLGEQRRIKVKKLRGVVSMGLLVPAPPGAQVGDDVTSVLGVTHYDPPAEASTGGEAALPPIGYHPNYDVDSLRRYASVFVPGELVFVSEKVHGSSARFCCIDGRMHVGSRTEWKKPGSRIDDRQEPESLWWRALAKYPQITLFLQSNSDVTVYGEIYGRVQDLHYGVESGHDVRLAIFDLLLGSQWVSARDARGFAPDLPWVPTVADGVPFDFDTVLALAEGPSLVPGAPHVREGVVVKPLIERTCLELGRVNLKVIGNGYMGRK